MLKKYLYIILFILLINNFNITGESFNSSLAPESNLINSLSPYLNFSNLLEKMGDLEFRKKFKLALLLANLEDLSFWIDNLKSNYSKSYELEIFKNAHNTLIKYLRVGKKRKSFDDFSLQILVYKSFLLLLYGNNISLNITKQLLTNIRDYAEDPYNIKYDGYIRGIAGVISGMFEVTIKKGTLLVDIPLIKNINIPISENDTHDIHEWDALSKDSVFEFKFTASLSKLYSQIFGLSRTFYYFRSISEGDNSFINHKEIMNLIYFGENSSPELTIALLLYKEKKSTTFNHSAEKGISIKFSIDEFIDFLTDENTLYYLKKESNEFRYLTREIIEHHVQKNLKKYISILKNRAKNSKRKFDIIIGISNPYRTNIYSSIIRGINKLDKAA